MKLWLGQSSLAMVAIVTSKSIFAIDMIEDNWTNVLLLFFVRTSEAPRVTRFERANDPICSTTKRFEDKAMCAPKKKTQKNYVEYKWSLFNHGSSQRFYDMFMQKVFVKHPNGNQATWNIQILS